MRLLLAEDEKSLSRALTRILESSHYSVDAAYNGEEALDFLDVSSYDAVILDLMMPKVDGLTVLRTLRQHGSAPSVCGVDISRDALICAHRRAPELTLAVASIAHLPVADASCVFDLFFGTDYHSHLGTRRGGLVVLGLW